MTAASGAGPINNQNAGWSAEAAATVAISTRVRTKLEAVMSLWWLLDVFVRLEWFRRTRTPLVVFSFPFTT